MFEPFLPSKVSSFPPDLTGWIDIKASMTISTNNCKDILIFHYQESFYTLWYIETWHFHWHSLFKHPEHEVLEPEREELHGKCSGSFFKISDADMNSLFFTPINAHHFVQLVLFHRGFWELERTSHDWPPGLTSGNEQPSPSKQWVYVPGKMAGFLTGVL